MHSFPKSARLLKKRQFKRVQAAKNTVVGSCIIIQYIIDPNNLQRKLGITASRHYGNSVQRNRFKRLCREAFRLTQSQLPAGIHLIIKPRPYALSATAASITKELLKLIQQIKRILSTSVNPMSIEGSYVQANHTDGS